MTQVQRTRCSEDCRGGCLAAVVVDRTVATLLTPLSAAMPGIAATSAGFRDDWRRADAAADGDGFFARLAVSLIALSCKCRNECLRLYIFDFVF